MNSKCFDSAVSALVQIHRAEISQLQQQLVQALQSNSTLFAEDAEEFLVPREAYPQQLCTPRLLPSTPTQIRCAPRLTPPSLMHTGSCLGAALRSSASESPVFSPVDQRSRLVSQLDAAENTNAEIGPTSGDGQCLDDCQELHGSWLGKWVVLVHGVMDKKEAVGTVREGWSKLSKKRTVTLECQAELDSLNQSLARSQRMARSQYTKGGMTCRLTQSFVHVSSQRRFPLLRSQPGMLAAHPESLSCRAWNLLTWVVVLYEVAAITMAPFDVFGNGGSACFETISGIFWILDIILTFFTGVYINGRLELRLHVIARRYLRTWFTFDLTVAVMHLVATFANTTTVLARTVRVLRLGRMLAWTRVVLARVQSRSAMFWTKVAQCLVALYFFVHFNACLWYEIGKSENGWVFEYQRLGKTAGEKYLVAMHLSLAQLQGNADIYPGTSIHDRAYCVVSSFASIIFLALLVSIMTDALFTAQNERKVLNEQIRMVEKFMNRHHVKPELRNRAEYYLQSIQHAKHSVAHEDQDREALEVFPLPLRLPLLAESRAPILNWHPLFSYLQDFHMTAFINVCSGAICWQAYQPEDHIFMKGESSTGAYYTASGDFIYTAMVDLFGALNPWLGDFMGYRSKSLTHASGLTSSTMSDATHMPTYRDMMTQKNKGSVTRLQTGQLVAEISLWSPWVHTGDMLSVSHGQCFNIQWSDLVTLLAQYSQPYEVFCYYAARFAGAANNLRSIGRSDQMIELMGFADMYTIEDDFNEHESQIEFRGTQDVKLQV